MKNMMQLHWEKFVLGLVLISLPALLGFGARMPEMTVIKEIELGVDGKSTVIPDPPPISNPPIHAPVGPGSQPPAFADSYRTKFNGIVNIIPGTQGPRVAPAGVRVGKPVVAPEGITLVLVPDSPVTRFVIERKSAREDWSVIGRTTKDPAYFDGTVVPMVEYSYRVKPDSAGPATYSNVVTATAADIWTITFENPTEADHRVFVTIKKYDREFGPIVITHIHAEGEKVGTWADVPGKPTSVHRVKSEKLGRQVDADFDTGCVLEKITFGKEIPYTYEACPKSYDCPGVETKKATRRTTEILYRDGDKKAVEVHLGGFKLAGSRCADHGGAR